MRAGRPAPTQMQCCCRTSQVAASAGGFVTPQTMNEIVTGLEALSVIERRRNTADGACYKGT